MCAKKFKRVRDGVNRKVMLSRERFYDMKCWLVKDVKNEQERQKKYSLCI